MKKHVVAVVTLVGSMFATVAAFAAEATGGAAAAGEGHGLAIFGLMLGMGIATFGGALGQGKAAAAALEGIARNPGAANKVQTPMILGLALIESLVLFSLLIAFILQGKI